jgi:NAD-dependent deacetylase
MSEEIDKAVQLLADARTVLFITGAGISADSGLPTYRGIGGLYEQEETEDGIPIEHALSGPVFRSHPELTWKYIRQIEQACRGARPNAAHRCMAAFERRLERTCVLTQNVDGLHRAAGSSCVIDIHGDIHDLCCTACSWATRVGSYADLPALPRCPECGAVVRPRVVLFGEMLPPTAVDELEHQLGLGFDVVVSCGTSSLFPYVAHPVVESKAIGRPTIEINPGETMVSELCDVRVRARAAETVSALWEGYCARTGRS